MCSTSGASCVTFARALVPFVTGFSVTAAARTTTDLRLHAVATCALGIMVWLLSTLCILIGWIARVRVNYADTTGSAHSQSHVYNNCRRKCTTMRCCIA